MEEDKRIRIPGDKLVGKSITGLLWALKLVQQNKAVIVLSTSEIDKKELYRRFQKIMEREEG